MEYWDSIIPSRQSQDSMRVQHWPLPNSIYSGFSQWGFLWGFNGISLVFESLIRWGVNSCNGTNHVSMVWFLLAEIDTGTLLFCFWDWLGVPSKRSWQNLQSKCVGGFPIPNWHTSHCRFMVLVRPHVSDKYKSQKLAYPPPTLVFYISSINPR